MLDDAPSSATTTRSPSCRGRWSLRFSTATTATLLPQYSPVADDDSDSDLLSKNGLGVGDDDDTVIPLISLSSSPPRYSAIHPITLAPPVAGSSILHDSAEAGVRSNHFQYIYPIKSTKPWARLLLFSPEAVPGDPSPLLSQPKVPRIWGSEPITGRIELDLDSPLTIQQINIIVKGKITASVLHDGSHKFLDYAFNLWDASEGGGFDRKLTGIHSFPFCLPFPNAIDSSLEPTSPSDTFFPPAIKEVSLQSPTKPDSPSKGNSFFTFPLLGRHVSGTRHPKKQLTLCPLDTQCISHPPPSSVASSIPQTFKEKGITATVKYQLSVQFVHGRFMKHDSRITTDICHIPASQPHPCSPKRRQAYESGALIPGPMNDPDGWFDLPTASVDGIFKGLRQSKVDCKFYLAQPLSYTRGTVIPCYLKLSSNDSEALASLSNPDIPNVKLIRRLCHFAVEEDEMRQQLFLPVIPTSQRPDSNLLCKTVHHEVTTATWWVPTKEVPQDTHVRHLEGEIHLHPDLQPSCSSQVFRVDYFVQMFSLQ